MSERDAQIFEQGTKVQTSPGNSAEWKMVCALDRKRELERYAADLEKMKKGTLSVPGFLKQVVPNALEEILYTLHTTKDEKLKVNTAQDLLDRAGHGKISKAVVAHTDMGYEDTKRELINKVVTLARKAGIKVNEETGDEECVEAEVISDSGPTESKLPEWMEPHQKSSGGDSE